MAGGVTVIRTGTGTTSKQGTSKQGLNQFEGVSAESVGAERICAHLLIVPPGGRARAHRHMGHESVIYVIEGRVATWHGERLENRVDSEPGDLLYIPPGVPHVPINLSDTERAVGLVARTDPNEQESVELLPDLDDLPHLQAVADT